MTSASLPLSGVAAGGRPGLAAMAGIEARRFVRHPVFLVGNVLAFGVLALMYFLDDAPHFGDVLSIPVVPAFFIGFTSLITAARLTRSSDGAAEALGTAPGTEARRTAALALACLVPFAAGLLFLAGHVAAAQTRGVHEVEWWFGTMPDWQVWSILVALEPVACLGGGLLGVLVGRWLRFPGAAAVVIVLVCALCMAGQLPFAYESSSELRLWAPWAMFHSGTGVDGTAVLFEGNPLAYLGYVLCLCAAAVVAALWHDRTARTRALRVAFAAVVVAGLACLALAATTGPRANQTSEPIPYKISD